MKQCQEIAQLRGVEAIRMSYLYDGSDKEELEIPPIEVFVNNYNRKWQIPDIHIKQLIQITSLNCLKRKGTAPNSMHTTLFCFLSLFNHNRETNVNVEYVSHNLVFVTAS